MKNKEKLSKKRIIAKKECTFFQLWLWKMKIRKKEKYKNKEMKQKLKNVGK